jgi:hypothetical protein
VALLLVGLIGFFLYQYVPLFLDQAMPRPDRTLTAIVLFYFVAMLIIVDAVMSCFHRKTGHIYVGTFISAMIVTWSLTAGQAPRAGGAIASTFPVWHRIAASRWIRPGAGSRS